MTYALGAVCKLTGLSPDVIRAWERRHAAVQPSRTPGGTRRYGEADVRRLLLLAEATRAGHTIGSLAPLSDEQLAGLIEPRDGPDVSQIRAAIDALDRLDAGSLEDIASRQLIALGAARFAREFAMPLLEEVGELWASQKLCVASEHLGTQVLRSLMGASLRPSQVSRRGPTVLFCTPPGELHELGVLAAALVALGAGCNALYFGSQLPADEVTGAARRSGAAAVAASVVTLDAELARGWIRELRGELPARITLWVGGSGARDLELPTGVAAIPSFDDLERRATLLATTH